MRECYRNGVPIPDKFNNAPRLLPGLDLYFSAYEELVSFMNVHRDRPPILWADVHSYAMHHGFTHDQRRMLMKAVAELEGVNINWHTNKVQQKRRAHGHKTRTTLAKNSKAQP